MQISEVEICVNGFGLRNRARKPRDQALAFALSNRVRPPPRPLLDTRPAFDAGRTPSTWADRGASTGLLVELVRPVAAGRPAARGEPEALLLDIETTTATSRHLPSSPTSNSSGTAR